MKPAEAPVSDVDPSLDEFTSAGLVPRRSRYPATGYPMVRWPWRTVRQALAAMAATTPPEAPVALRYVDPTTGRAPLRTMGAEARWLRPGERSSRTRRTAGAVFHVVEGRGESVIGDTRLSWERGDTFVAPPWHWTAHVNAASEPAYLFAFTDEPAVEALGLYVEETA
jgi:gentisate 1,2-dioxygenase